MLLLIPAVALTTSGEWRFDFAHVIVLGFFVLMGIALLLLSFRAWLMRNEKLPSPEARARYNFVKPHQALEGQTPAERAGVGVEGKNKWLELLKCSLAED